MLKYRLWISRIQILLFEIDGVLFFQLLWLSIFQTDLVWAKEWKICIVNFWQIENKIYTKWKGRLGIMSGILHPVCIHEWFLLPIRASSDVNESLVVVKVEICDVIMDGWTTASQCTDLCGTCALIMPIHPLGYYNRSFSINAKCVCEGQSFSLFYERWYYSLFDWALENLISLKNTNTIGTFPL